MKRIASENFKDYNISNYNIKSNSNNKNNSTYNIKYLTNIPT